MLIKIWKKGTLNISTMGLIEMKFKTDTNFFRVFYGKESRN